MIVGLSSKGRLIGFDKDGSYADNRFRYIDALRVVTEYLLKGHIVAIADEERNLT